MRHFFVVVRLLWIIKRLLYVLVSLREGTGARAPFQTGTFDTGKVVCNKCHPYFTGKQKLVDASGRVELFNKKYGLGGNKK